MAKQKNIKAAMKRLEDSELEVTVDFYPASKKGWHGKYANLKAVTRFGRLIEKIIFEINPKNNCYEAVVREEY